MDMESSVNPTIPYLHKNHHALPSRYENSKNLMYICIYKFNCHEHRRNKTDNIRVTRNH